MLAGVTAGCGHLYLLLLLHDHAHIILPVLLDCLDPLPLLGLLGCPPSGEGIGGGADEQPLGNGRGDGYVGGGRREESLGEGGRGVVGVRCRRGDG